jgi:hypothetical protein
MFGGFRCGICKNQGSAEIISPNELNECASCGYIVCSVCLGRIYHVCPQERKNKTWKVIRRTNPNYENDAETTKEQVKLTTEQQADLEKEQEKARKEAEELRNRAEASTQPRLPVVEDPFIPFILNDNYDINGFDRRGIHRDTGTQYDPTGYNYNGYNSLGFNRGGIHMNTRTQYDLLGFNNDGIHIITGTQYNTEGYERSGHNSWGFNSEGIHRNTGTQYYHNGFNRRGIHRNTGTQYNPEGYNRDGYNKFRFNKDGIHKDTGTRYNPNGFDRVGYNEAGFDSDGYNLIGFNKEGIHRNTNSKYDTSGYDIYGYNNTDYNRMGFNKEGIHRNTNTKLDPIGHDIKTSEKIVNDIRTSIRKTAKILNNIKDGALVNTFIEEGFEYFTILSFLNLRIIMYILNNIVGKKRMSLDLRKNLFYLIKRLGIFNTSLITLFETIFEIILKEMIDPPYLFVVLQQELYILYNEASKIKDITIWKKIPHNAKENLHEFWYNLKPKPEKKDANSEEIDELNFDEIFKNDCDEPSNCIYLLQKIIQNIHIDVQNMHKGKFSVQDLINVHMIINVLEKTVADKKVMHDRLEGQFYYGFIDKSETLGSVSFDMMMFLSFKNDIHSPLVSAINIILVNELKNLCNSAYGHLSELSTFEEAEDFKSIGSWYKGYYIQKIITIPDLIYIDNDPRGLIFHHFYYSVNVDSPPGYYVEMNHIITFDYKP